MTSRPIAALSRVITTPVRHGWTLLIPRGWQGEVEDVEQLDTPAAPVAILATESISEARQIANWREPTLPAGWHFWRASAGSGYDSPVYGYTATYGDAQGYKAVEILVTGRSGVTHHEPVSGGNSVDELRIIDGHAARVRYDPPVEFPTRPSSPTRVVIFDDVAGLNYIVYGYHPLLRGDIDATVEIARSLYRTMTP